MINFSVSRISSQNGARIKKSKQIFSCFDFFIYASNEPKSVLARDLGDSRDNLRNSRSVFLIVKKIAPPDFSGRALEQVVDHFFLDLLLCNIVKTTINIIAIALIVLIIFSSRMVLFDDS